MGRTHLPYSMQIELIDSRFKNLRRALRKEDQKVFDRLLRYARMQVQAGAMASNPNPFDSMALTMLIEIQKQLDTNQAELSQLRQEFESFKQKSIRSDVDERKIGAGD
ncbi:MAG: hypothetical protein K8S54_18840 [Spirochaetia bacterium]|nr:hypothetical protein [Spirochaetia bacterium]